MSEQQPAQFDGWAVVEVFGHQKYAGYVTSETYGSAVMFRVDVPALEARTRETKRPGWVNSKYVPAGTIVEEGAVAGYTKLLGVGSIFAITPCTQEAALAVVEEIQHRPLMHVTLPEGEQAALPPAADDNDALNDADGYFEDDEDDDEDDDISADIDRGP